MHHFHYRDAELFCEEIPLAVLAEKVGTPFYLYSLATLTRHFRVFDEAFGSAPHLICYSAKANSNLAILKIFVSMGAGVDIVSGGELYRALAAGCDPKKIVYSGVGKTREEIDYALKSEILMFNVESSMELKAIANHARALGKKAPIALRVNPDVDPKTHPYVATGLKKNKFGIDIERALSEYKAAQKLEGVRILGLDCHIGSQLTEVGPFVDAVSRLKQLMGRLRQEGISIQYLDLGGGLGITYEAEEPPHPHEYAQALLKELGDFSATLILEPGRVIVGNAGILVTRVLYLKEGVDRTFVIVDAGMNDLIRPSLYGAYQAVLPVKKDREGHVVADVVGPICESGDFFAKGRKIARFEPGDLMAIMSAGAYGFSMASNYNSRPRGAEVLVDKDKYYIIRERESYSDLVRGERVLDLLGETL